MTAPRTQSAVLLLAVVVVLGPVAGVGIVAQPAAAQPAGFVGLSESQVSEDVPTELDTILDWNVSDLLALLENRTMTDEHASTLNETLVVVDKRTGEVIDQEYLEPYLDPLNSKDLSDIEPGMALQFSDGTNHEGRRIAVPASALKQALGRKPGLAFGRHENGTQWIRAVEYEYDENTQTEWAIFRVPAFSTNTITWSGQFTIETDPSTDGAQFTYDQNTTPVGNYTINVTGHEATEIDVESGSGVDVNSTASVNIDGTKDPTGPASGDPELELTGNRITKSASVSGCDLLDDGEEYVINVDGTDNITTVELTDLDHDGTDGSNDFGVYLANGDTKDGTTGDGTKVGSFTTSSSNEGDRTIDTGGFTVTGTAVTVEIDATTLSGNDDTNICGEVRTKTPPPSGVDVTDDNGDVSVSFGDFTAGQTKTKALTGLNTSSTSLTLSGTNGELDWTLNYTEHTETVDPSIQVNANWTNHTGTVADGSTVSLTTNSAWVIDGTNTVNVSVGDGSLSADAPTPSVDLFYTHDGSDESVVEFTAEKWTESYNVSKTYSQDRSNAQITIPFSANVVRIRSIEKSINGGSFSSVGVDNYSLSGNELTADLGAVTAGDEVRVRTDGSKVNPNNSTITVLETTVTGDANLDTKIRLDSWASDSYIGVGGTEVGKEPHYATSESWSGTEYVVIDADGTQELHLPGAADGDEFRARTIPVEVNPAAGADVRLEVTSTDSTPAFQVRPGPGGGGSTEVEYVYLEGETGKTYELFSQSNDIVRSSATASSPVTLVDDDSEEILEIRVASDGGTGGGDGGGGGGGGLIIRDPGPLGVPLTILGLVAAVLVLAVATGRTRGMDTGARARSGARRVLSGTVGRVPVVGRALTRVLARAVGGLAGFGRTAFLVEPQVFVVGIGVIALFLGLRFGLIELTGQLRNAILFIGAPALAFLAMRRLGRFDIRVFAAITLLAGVALLETLNPGSIAGPVGEQLGQGALIIALAVLFLLYRWWQARQRRQTARSVAEVLRGGEGP